MKKPAIILAAAATLIVAVSASPSAIRPDDRAGILGIGQAAQVDESDVVSRYLISHATSVRPDDRAGFLGVGQAVQADESDVVSRYLISHATSVRPDDRAGWRGAGPQPLVVAEPTATGTNWGDLAWGVLIGAGAMLAVLAAAYAGRRHIHRPHVHRPHFHRPHFPLHGH